MRHGCDTVHAEILNVLEKHPKLCITFAHMMFLSDNIDKLNNVEYKIVEKYVTEHFAFIKFECEKDNKLMFYQSFVLSDDGVKVIVEGNDALEITFPVFDFDGKENTEISIDENRVEVKYNNSVCEFLCDGVIKDNEMVLGNRNGHYKAFSVCGNDKVSLTIKIN